MVSAANFSPDECPSQAEAHSLAALRNDIVCNGFAFRTGMEMRAIMRARGLNAWPAFASSWNDLGLDVYMADGGRYRRRRFAAFAVADGVVTVKPRQSHYQSRDHNALNGGIERWFMPVTEVVTNKSFAQGILSFCTMLFDSASSPQAIVLPWHVEMHQFRIEAMPRETGMPTPEGSHRDGVDWVCVMLINRTNVSSGVTQIFDPEGRPLGEFTLTDPLDAVFLDDRRIFHGVTPICAARLGEQSLSRCASADISP
jgi:hypothetical protein